jgi:predicted phosphodiesterase
LETSSLPLLAGKIGLIGDVHSEDQLLERTLAHFAERQVGRVLCTGDVVDGKGSVDRCCELLERAGALVVRGNHDRWVRGGKLLGIPDATAWDTLAPASQAFLHDLPVIREFSTPLGRALLCHGMGTNDMSKIGPGDQGMALETNDDLQALIREGRYRLVFNGHSHRPMVRHFGGLTIVNAGTLKRDHQPGAVIVDFDRSAMNLFPFDGNGRLGREPETEYRLRE